MSPNFDWHRQRGPHDLRHLVRPRSQAQSTGQDCVLQRYQEQRRDWYDLRYLDRYQNQAQCQHHTCLRIWTSTVTATRTISGTSYVTDRKLSHLAKTVCGNSTRNNAGAGPISRTSTATDIKLSGIATHVTEL